MFMSNGATKAVSYWSVPQSLRNKKGTKILGKKLDGNKLLKVSLVKDNIDFVLESSIGELAFVRGNSMPIENLDTIGKYAKNIRGENLLKNVYTYVVD